MTETKIKTTLTPMLAVKNGAAAVEYYQKAFGAELIDKMEIEGKLIIAALSIDGANFYISDESPDLNNLGPSSLSGRTTVRMELEISDPDEFARKAVAGGATIMFPIEDRDYGYRQGRIVDPFGHHWIIGRKL